MAHLNYT